MPAVIRPTGMNSSPIPRKTRGCPTYIRKAVVISDPHDRRRRTRNGAAGRHSVREASQSNSTMRTASRIRLGDGSPTMVVSRLEPAPTAEQKKLVVVRPSWSPSGIA